MTEIIKNDPEMLRSCILYEFIEGIPIFETFKKLCRKFGEDFMDYPEFEFWYMRFAQGKYDLDYDRSLDPKTRLFTDLPVEIFEKVGEYLKLEDRFQLRDVCKDIRFQVDNWVLNMREFRYRSANKWDIYLKSQHFGQNENNLLRRNARIPISSVMSVLKLPKLRLEKLTISDQYDCWKKLIKRLDESNRKLYVMKVEFPYSHSSEIDLHYMIPGVLEEINLFIENPTREDFCEIIASEQCQAAKMVYIESPTITSEFPLDALYNCPRFTLRLEGAADDLKANFLKKLMEYGEVQKCVLYMLGPSDSRDIPCQIMKHFNEPEAMVPNRPSLRRYQIPGTNEFYELDYQENVDYREEVVRLERKQ
ncbi:hypothetical protein CRE_11460 [Caenorhabditis remanei]|uniref:F-box domain-containing protein n=1 Tax=Caenorhabditis remanei TaxID=31234 RepID=E3NBE7_CAERE|nr:hypothetical protein CRE_11460 [Caenorhabditis remanei]